MGQAYITTGRTMKFEDIYLAVLGLLLLIGVVAMVVIDPPQSMIDAMKILPQ